MKKKNKKVLITPEGFKLIQNRIEDFMHKNISYQIVGGLVSNKKKLIGLLEDASGCIIGSEKIDNEVLERCNKLEILCRFGSGLDNIDLIAAKKKGIKVTNVEVDSIPKAVAIHALSLILSITQNLKSHFNDARKAKWKRHLNMFFDEVTIGFVGSGKIGSIIIRMCIDLGFNVFYTSKSRKLKLDKYGAKYVPNIEKLIQKSSIISLHIPKIKGSEPIINKKLLKKMKNKSLINTARGSLVDEEALLESLDNNQLNFYATDVTKSEPPIGISKMIINNKKVISTAHVGGYNETSLKEVSIKSLVKVNNVLLN